MCKWIYGAPGFGQSLVVVVPSPQKLNNFAYLTVNFACNFAHECFEHAERLVGLLYSQMQMGDMSPYPSPYICPYYC